MLCEELGLGVHHLGEMGFERFSDLLVQCLARTAQQCAIGGVLYERMLEQKTGVWWCAALEDQAGLDEPMERVLQLRLAMPRNGGQQLVREVAADRSADLRDFLGCRAQPVQAGQQRGVQARWNRQ